MNGNCGHDRLLDRLRDGYSHVLSLGMEGAGVMIDHRDTCAILTDGLCTCRATHAAMTYGEFSAAMAYGVTPPSTYDVGRGIADDVLGRRPSVISERPTPTTHTYSCAACHGEMWRTKGNGFVHAENGEVYCPDDDAEEAWE